MPIPGGRRERGRRRGKLDPDSDRDVPMELSNPELENHTL